MKKKNQQRENFILQYSPRTEYTLAIEQEEKLYKELKLNFDPITIKVIKKHFKERLGMLTKEVMIAILKNHGLAFIPNHPNREVIMVKLLSRLFSDIDLNDNGTGEWNEFTNYIIHSSNPKEKNKNNKDYRLKFYSNAHHSINPSDGSEIISYAFFIDKFNIIGCVQEGKSTIHFFDVRKCKKQKFMIDGKDIQPVVDLLTFSELNNRAVKEIEYDRQEKELKRAILQESMNMRNNNNNSMSSTLISMNEKGRALKEKREKSKPDENMELLSKDELGKTTVNKRLSIGCTCFIPEYDCLLVSGTNNTITAWQYNSGEFKNANVTQDFRVVKEELKIAIGMSDSPQYSMVWDPHLKHGFTGQKDGKIGKWDLTRSRHLDNEILDIKTVKPRNDLNSKAKNKTQNEKEQSKRLKEQGKQKSIRHRGKIDFLIDDKDKNESVSCGLGLSKLQLGAASYYNGYGIGWDTLLKDYRKLYSDQTTGIYSMSFDATKNLIFTCGFDHDIYVYDPYIDGQSVYKGSGHSWSINSIDVCERESELISLDFLGNIKIWDTQSLGNFQTIKLNEEFEDTKKNPGGSHENSKVKKLSSNLRMLFIRKFKKILIYGSKLLMFETDRTNCPDGADDQVICACYYDKTVKTLLSFCLRKIKIWNILTGKVKQIYDDPMNNEITALTIDLNVKRGFLGDNTGKIKNINLRNGLTIKDLTSHSNEIKFICHSMALNVVASCSIDNVIKIHDDKELLETEVIKELSVFQFQVRALCIVDRFSRLCFGLSNGTVKFYDIEHFHYDSDLATDPSGIKDEISAVAPIDNIELVLCCYSNGVCKFIVTPPSTAKFNSIYEFNNTSAESPIPIAISCIEFDKLHDCIFIGDLLGNIKSYNIGDIYQIQNKIKSKDIYKNFDIEPYITKDNIAGFNSLKIDCIWAIEAHKESIKHIHFVNIEPNIIITTSHDLRIKIFDAGNGKFKDEFKQSSNKMKSIPVSIKYYLGDPFGGDENEYENKEAYTFTRKEVENFQPNTNINDNDNQQIAEYSKKITEFNAKEKLWLNCRGSTVPDGGSNNWNGNIDTKQVGINEQREFNEGFEHVKRIEKITKETEMIGQEKSIYSESYKPKYIEQMDNVEEIKQFSKVISERGRHVKLAVSKANLNQSKMKDLTKKKVPPKIISKSKSTADMLTSIKKKATMSQMKERGSISKGDAINEGESNHAVSNNSFQVSHRKNSNTSLNIFKSKLLPPISGSQPLANTKSMTNVIKSNPTNTMTNMKKIKSNYSINTKRGNTPAQHFNKGRKDFQGGYKEIFYPFKGGMKKSKSKRLLFATNEEYEKEEVKKLEEEKKRRFMSLEADGYKLES